MTGRLRDVDLLILVWRESPELIERFFAGVRRNFPSDWVGRMVIVSNGADIATVGAVLRESRRGWSGIRRVVIRVRRSRGFAAAINLGLFACSAPWVAVFNPDGELMEGTIRRLHDVACQSHGCLAVSARVVEGPVAEPPRPGVTDVEFALGGASVFRRSALLHLGGYDPVYFLFLEDSDLGVRARQRRWRLLRVEDAVFQHAPRPRPALEEWHRERHLTTSVAIRAWLTAEAPVIGVRKALGVIRRRRAESRGALGARAWAVAIAATAYLLRNAPSILSRRRHGWTHRALVRWTFSVRGVTCWLERDGVLQRAGVGGRGVLQLDRG